MTVRILFMGTPDFAVASLSALLAAGHEVCGVFTQPDKPKNRGMKLQASPVKEFALAHDIPVFQPVKMRDGEAMGYIRDLDPELLRHGLAGGLVGLRRLMAEGGGVDVKGDAQGVRIPFVQQLH